MFKHAYQGGTHVELLQAAGKTPLKDWKVEGKVQQRYDKNMKGSLFILGDTSKISLPPDEKSEHLGLVQ